ncbi:unnamed protein product [Ambrosiozyma monospora]|uniref:Unnamed protein product n=1 Tax=Ambrosiozyma monospora TaxID=43982 RepID=A0ACB5TAM1_AMBMO|nr:unnamed protein product [Ambrosiozyma monospora]
MITEISQSGNHYHFPAEVLNITKPFLFEIRCLVLNYVILIFANKLTIYPFDAFPNPIIKLLGYNPALDNIIDLALQDLQFNQYIITDVYFNEIASFILSRSTPLKRLSIVDCNPCAVYKRNTSTNVSVFMQRFQILDVHCDYYEDQRRQFQMLYIQHATTLTMKPELFLLVMGRGQKLYRLVTLKLGFDLSKKEIDSVKEIPPENETYHCISDLTNLNSRNRDIITASIRITGTNPHPLASDVYLRLFNQCVVLHLRERCPRTSSNMNWIERIPYYKCVSINLDWEVVRSLNLRNAEFLKELRLYGHSVDASLFNIITDTLHSLYCGLENEFNDLAIELPLSLRNLEIATMIVPTISNAKMLKNLKDVKIYLTNSVIPDRPGLSFDKFFRMQLSIERLPPVVTNLDLSDDAGKIDIEEHLSFNHLFLLENLNIGTYTFESSSLYYP